MREVKLSKGYEPLAVESNWIEYWEEEASFTPDPEESGKPYSMVIPPPNVTGSLHMGHALNLTLQDILCRYHRQQGFKVLWVPGTDHAGIATQNVVERELAKEGKTREDVGREQFIERVWAWKEEYGGKILNQVRRMGASVDWSRLRFTMDDGLSRVGAGSLCPPVRGRADLQGRLHHQLVSPLPYGPGRPGSGARPGRGRLHAIRYPLADGSGI
jgi:valyl-tRNA synthetase